MATLDELHQARFYALKGPEVIGDYNPANAIPTYFRTHPEIGSPLGPEIDLPDGAKGQAFAGGVVVWDPTNGARLVRE